jgi:DNA-binding HxlR family transcriptional regulator
VSVRKSYNQNCPVAMGLDVLGERWTLLILRELLGGPRRYSDLRSELPGIATNLLAERLRGLEDAGLVERRELPAPIARTVYSLSDEGWRTVPPVILAIANFGLGLMDLADHADTPLNGFLAAVALGFQPSTGGDVDATYRVVVDGRVFDFALRHGVMGPGDGAKAVTAHATAVDLITARTATQAARRKSALRRVTFEGDPDAVRTFREVFNLPSD